MVGWNILRLGAVADLREFSESAKKKLYTDLTLVHVSKSGATTYTKTLTLHRNFRAGGKTYLSVPRSWLFEQIGADHLKINFVPRLEPAWHAEISPNWTTTISLTEDQSTMVAALTPHFSDIPVNLNDNDEEISWKLLHDSYSSLKPCGGAILVAGTGMGKTYMGAAMISLLARPTLIVVPKKSILDEWIEVLTRELPLIRIGQLGGGCIRSGGVIVAIINSLLGPEIIDLFATELDCKTTSARVGKLSPIQWFRHFDFVIFDEVHNYATPERVEIFHRACVPYLLGLTATPDERADGFDSAYQMFIGPIVKPVIRAEKEVRFHGTIHVINYHGLRTYTTPQRSSSGKNHALKSAMKILEDPDRWEMTWRVVRELLDRGICVYLFIDTRDDVLRATETAAKERFPDISSRIFAVMGGTEVTKAELRTAKIIIVTYAYGREGLSIDVMTAMVLVTPHRRGTRQTFGRILRRGGNPDLPRILIDIVDSNSFLRQQFADREPVYRNPNNSFKIVYRNVWPDQIPDPMLIESESCQNDDESEIKIESSEEIPEAEIAAMIDEIAE